jgi:hypothetical protein
MNKQDSSLSPGVSELYDVAGELLALPIDNNDDGGEDPVDCSELYDVAGEVLRDDGGEAALWSPKIEIMLGRDFLEGGPLLDDSVRHEIAGDSGGYSPRSMGPTALVGLVDPSKMRS